MLITRPVLRKYTLCDIALLQFGLCSYIVELLGSVIFYPVFLQKLCLGNSVVQVQSVQKFWRVLRMIRC